MTSRQTVQLAAVQERDALRLIPPLAAEFPATLGTSRARPWALERRYLLADGIPPCAHGLYLMASCPKGTCRTHFRQLDHARVWVPADGIDAGRPFLLSHPYSPQIADETKTYARAHGLDLPPACSGDDWYGHGTLPVAMTVPDNWPLWPVERAVAVLLATQPVEWPADLLPAGQDAR